MAPSRAWVALPRKRAAPPCTRASSCVSSHCRADTVSVSRSRAPATAALESDTPAHQNGSENSAKSGPAPASAPAVHSPTLTFHSTANAPDAAVFAERPSGGISTISVSAEAVTTTRAPRGGEAVPTSRHGRARGCMSVKYIPCWSAARGRSAAGADAVAGCGGVYVPSRIPSAYMHGSCLKRSGQLLGIAFHSHSSTGAYKSTTASHVGAARRL